MANCYIVCYHEKRRQDFSSENESQALSSNESRPKYVHACNWLKNIIKKLEPHTKLSGERTLSKELGISYMTVRKAIDILVDQGYLYRVPAKGTFVADRRENLKKKTKNLAYFLDENIHDGLASPYYSLIFHCLEKEAAARGFNLVYFSSINEGNAASILNKVDGVIASCFPRVEETIQLIKQHVPIIVIDNDSVDKSIPSIVIDNFNAIIEAVDHLCGLGHSKIAFLTGLEDSDVGKNRLAGYRHALRTHRIPIVPEYICKGDYSFEAGSQGAQQLLNLSTPPTAIICANDQMALGAIKTITRAGLSTPKDVSIVGFDDIKVASQVIPPLTTIGAPIAKIASLSVSLINDIIHGKELSVEHHALQAHLIKRGTTTKPKD